MGLIDFVKRNLGKLVLAGVAVYSVVYAVAFVRLYSMEHPSVVASRWIYENVPAGSRFVAPHWDDRVPVGIPGKAPSIYVFEGRDNELPFYEKDTPQNLDLLARRFSTTDYIAFATPRIADSIPRIPEEYPNTTALLRLLWGEKLGFTLVKSVKNRPSFLGATFQDDLADESFSVYDHPKVTIFQNVERLSKEEILARVKDVERYEPLPTMNEMLLMDAGGWQPSPRLWNPMWTRLMIPLVVVCVLGLGVWVLGAVVLRGLPDRGLGVSAFVGLCLGAVLAWGSAAIGLLPLSASAGRFIVGAIVTLALLRLMLRGDVRASLVEPLRRHGLPALAAFLCGVVIVAVLRSGDGAMRGVGDQVESIYLTYHMRNTSVPLHDVLRPEGPRGAFQGDHFALGWLLRTSGTPVAEAVDAAMWVLGGVIGGLLYTVIAALFRRGRLAPLLAVVILIIPTVYVVYAARDAANVASAGGNLLATSPGAEQLRSWVTKNIPNAPLVVEACDEPGLKGLSARLGLPTFAGASSGDAQAQTLCSSSDPDHAFQTMMRYGLQLLITPGVTNATASGAVERLGRFSARSDLFSKVYDDGSFVIFAPTFSNYFRPN